MCGVAGGYIKNKRKFAARHWRQDIEALLLLSARRGQDASGIAAFSGEQGRVFKQNQAARKFIAAPVFAQLIHEQLAATAADLSFLLQCRLMTNGSVESAENNQPIQLTDFVGVHNGIVIELAGQDIAINQNADDSTNDSKELFEYIQSQISSGQNIQQALQKSFAELVGEASIALYLQKTGTFALATNSGSLFYILEPEKDIFCFMSERYLLEQFLQETNLFKDADIKNIKQLKANQFLVVETFDLKSTVLSDLPRPKVKKQRIEALVPTISIAKSQAVSLRRCSHCILPETYPFISFDEQGVCNFCHRYHQQVFHGKEALLKFLEPYRSKDGSADCLVGLSGGRDSSYGLHVLKKELGMNPVAYTFDWGLTTDTSRRNQALLCGQLGIEHIIRSADLKEKRKNIQQNVEAFMKRPHLGMVPLFMAGDKEFYEYGRTLRRDLQLPLTVFCAGHSLEQRDFFTGFCGVDENIANNKRLFHFSLKNKIKLALFYSSQYALNPAYINSSLLDSVKSFFFSFIHRDDFLYLFEYWPWHEHEIEKTLAEYGWEADRGYGHNQWRMGDGQTAFTNYIYLAVAGFSEFDNFRSNQIREGMISRDEALKLVAEDNQPKMELLKYFASVVDLDLEAVLKKIDSIPKLY